jgi:hypothetical protein
MHPAKRILIALGIMLLAAIIGNWRIIMDLF